MTQSTEQVAAITKVMREHSNTIPDPDKSTSSWISWMCQCGGSISGGHDGHIAREILAALAAPAEVSR